MPNKRGNLFTETMKKTYLLLLIINMNVVNSMSNVENDINKLKIDSLFDSLAINNEYMGTISIFKKNQEIYSRSTGFADIKNDVLSNNKTRYRIGSISKTFTAVLIMQLVEENKLNLNDKLSEYFPEIKLSNHITIEQLLTHRSGIYNFTDIKDYESWMENPITNIELIDKINENKRRFKPNKKFEYSNSNYFLLSLIIEKIEGETFKKVLENKIIKPFKLSQTYCCSNEQGNDIAKSYYKTDNFWQEATSTDLRITSGAGGVVSTANDVNKFFNLLANHKIISEQSLDLMSYNLKDSKYGFGLFEIDFFNKSGYGHNGRIDGFISTTSYFPDDGISITYLNNGFRTDLNDVLIKVLAYTFKTDYVDKNKYSELNIFNKSLIQLQGNYKRKKNDFKIKLKKNILVAQIEVGTVQLDFGLTPITKNRFKIDVLGVDLEFYTNKNLVIIYDEGKEIKYKKKGKLKNK
jgi:D-alanyl-D-alanine carboxypeptidase|tara:strand:- start:50 stop:1444 length:1395 start_codon:yes stop_codon:yes gene_type:complete